MKKALALILALCLIFVLAACSKSEGSSSGGSSTPTSSGDAPTEKKDTIAKFENPVTVTFWNGWTGPDGELLKQLVDEYNSKNQKNVTVDMDCMQFASLQEKLATAIASHTCPNLHLGFAVGEYQMRHIYIPIDDIFTKTVLRKEDFVPEILQACTADDGHIYGIPFQVTSQFVYWNKDLFTQAGLDPEKGVPEWEDVITAAKAIDALGGNITGGGFDTSATGTVGAMINGYGGEVIAADDELGYKCVLTDPQYIEANKQALDVWYRYTHETNILQNGNLEEGYGAGVVGMLFGGAWQTANAKDHNINYGISLLPKGPKGQIQPGAPVSIDVMEGTEGDKYDACLDFIAYWNNNESNPIREKAPAYDWSLKQAYQPYLITVANDPTMVNDETFKVTNEYQKYVKNPYPANFWNGYQLGTAFLKPMIEAIAHDTATLDEALAQCQKDIDIMIEDDMYEMERSLGLRE